MVTRYLKYSSSVVVFAGLNKQEKHLKRLAVRIEASSSTEGGAKGRNREQILKLLEAAKGHPNEALFILALATGMRRGELLGLKWHDIDFEKGVLQVRRTLSRVPTAMVKELGTSYIEVETKTKRSRRSIILTDFAIEALKQHREKQVAIKQKAGDLWQEHDYVFCSSTDTYLGPGHNALVQLKSY